MKAHISEPTLLLAATTPFGFTELMALGFGLGRERGRERGAREREGERDKRLHSPPPPHAPPYTRLCWGGVIKWGGGEQPCWGLRWRPSGSLALCSTPGGGFRVHSGCRVEGWVDAFPATVVPLVTEESPVGLEPLCLKTNGSKPTGDSWCQASQASRTRVGKYSGVHFVSTLSHLVATLSHQHRPITVPSWSPLMIGILLGCTCSLLHPCFIIQGAELKGECEGQGFRFEDSGFRVQGSFRVQS